MGYVRIQSEPFDVERLRREGVTASTGAVTIYVGTVRAEDGHAVDALDVEAYAEMAQQELERIRVATIERFGLVDATIIHRVGRLVAGDGIIAAALFGRHRKETYAALDFLMDEVKRRVPIWKREEGPTGHSWILGQGTKEVVV